LGSTIIEVQKEPSLKHSGKGIFSVKKMSLISAFRQASRGQDDLNYGAKIASIAGALTHEI
jgi:hypothetical protein